MSCLGAGLLGALGWFAGAVLHLFGPPDPLPRHELRAAVPEEALTAVGLMAMVLLCPLLHFGMMFLMGVTGMMRRIHPRPHLI